MYKQGDTNPDGINATSKFVLSDCVLNRRTKAKDEFNFFIISKQVERAQIKVVAIIEGEFQSKVIDAEDKWQNH